jgi:hypothetical protein
LLTRCPPPAEEGCALSLSEGPHGITCIYLSLHCAAYAWCRDCPGGLWKRSMLQAAIRCLGSLSPGLTEVPARALWVNASFKIAKGHRRRDSHANACAIGDRRLASRISVNQTMSTCHISTQFILRWSDCRPKRLLSAHRHLLRALRPSQPLRLDPLAALSAHDACVAFQTNALLLLLSARHGLQRFRRLHGQRRHGARRDASSEGQTGPAGQAVAAANCELHGRVPNRSPFPPPCLRVEQSVGFTCVYTSA